MLKCWNILGLVLVLIWLISPLGGQASLYLIRPLTLEHVERQEVQYLDINGLSKAPNLSSFPRLTNALEAMFLACLIAPVSVKEADSDAWGNVKIPLLRSLVRNNTAQSEGWFEPAGNNITYSSLVGVPVFGISSRGNSTFQLQTASNSASHLMSLSMSIRARAASSESIQRPRGMPPDQSMRQLLPTYMCFRGTEERLQMAL